MENSNEKIVLGVGGIPSPASDSIPTIHVDLDFPAPDSYAKMQPGIREALKAYGYKGSWEQSEPEKFWANWLRERNWHGQKTFLEASIEHCKRLANQLAGTGNHEAAVILGRVLRSFIEIRDQEQLRLENLLREASQGAPAKAELSANTEKLALSPRDKDLHEAIGPENFRMLTNFEIRERFPKIAKVFGTNPTPDALKSSLDRIRKACGYPLSKEILEKRR